MSTKRLLFVCTGNSCRSVMAQWLTQRLLQRAGLTTVNVESAGVYAVDGMQPTRETRQVLETIGVDCMAHRARGLTPAMVQAADLVFVMEQFQMDDVLLRMPNARGKVHLLKPYGLDRGEQLLNPNIPDPIGKPMEVYEVCFAEVREAVERLVKSLEVQSR